MDILIAPITAGLLVFLSAAVQHASTVWAKGVGFVMTDRSTPLADGGFAGRAKRTLQNNLESGVMMIPLSLSAVYMNLSGALVTFAYIYAVARIGFTLCYWFALNPIRSAFWGVGMAMIAATGVVVLAQLIGG